MLLHSFFPGNSHDHPELGIQELLRAILVRTNFVPVVRHIIGWRGLKQSVAGVECWTAKIHGFSGVFGLSYDSVDSALGRVQGRFSLFYFPHPEEELVERCSLQAAALTQTKDYLPQVREFFTFPEFADFFRIGNVSLLMEEDGKGLALVLEALSIRRTLCEAGVSLPREGQMVQLIKPGGADQDFPAFEVASGFFNVLAASLTFNLDQPPNYLLEHRTPGFQMVCDRTGVVRRVKADDVWNCRIVLGYGEGRLEALDAYGEDTAPLHHWVSGQPVPEKFKDRLWWRANQLQGAGTIDKKALGIDERPPLIILTGFLGSGKTSFLKHFIEYQTQHSRFVAVIQNEIGAVGLDGKMLDYTVTEIDEGCVCCSLAGNLKRAIQGIFSAFDPDFIIVETTGLANPFNLLDEMNELEDLVRFDCTLTVVDALNVEKALTEHTIAAEQIRGADILMLNKKDLIGVDRLKSVTGQLRQINPRAPIFLTVNGDLNPALILEIQDRMPLADAAKDEAFHHHSHNEDGLWAKSIPITQPLDQKAFLQAVATLPPSIFRAKGILDFLDSPQPMLFQYVGGRHELSIFPQTPTEDRFLTIIGKGDDPERGAFAFQSLM
jgi:G3E family GTPase